MPTKSLSPYANNSRTHSEEQIEEIARSIKEFGFTNPVLIDELGGIVAGHGRVRAAKKLKLKEVPCIVLADLSETQRRAYVIADNRLALNAGWDVETLAAEIGLLKEADFDISVLGFGDDDLDSYLNAETPTAVKDGAKELKEDDFSEFEHQCPKCGFEFNGK